jgi:hypothetical protein
MVRRGFTLWELLVCLLVAIVIAALVLMLPNSRSRAGTGRMLKDSYQLRGIHTGMTIWAQNNQDRYPLPSLLDAQNATIDAPAETKDTTANIFSFLIFHGFFDPEICVSPAESNPAIKQIVDYEYDRPHRAADPKNALWDPGFSADFTNGNTGNLSYAHMQFRQGNRASLWAATKSATEPVLGNRGPRITGRTGKNWTFDTSSNTLLIHGRRNSWEGWVVYNDGHVQFEPKLSPEGPGVQPAKGKPIPDCLFFDEPEDQTGLNALLGICARIGPTPAEDTTIWD